MSSARLNVWSSTAWRSSGPRFPASRSCSDLADAWVFPYTDFGESHETLGRPILRASFTVGVPGHRAGFAALVDTGGPVTVIAPHVLAAAGSQAVPTGAILPIRLAGRSFRAPLFEITLDAYPPDGHHELPMSWRGLAGVLEPWPHQGTSLMLGQLGFMEQFTVTFGPDGFAVENGATFAHRFNP